MAAPQDLREFYDRTPVLAEVLLGAQDRGARSWVRGIVTDPTLQGLPVFDPRNAMVRVPSAHATMIDRFFLHQKHGTAMDAADLAPLKASLRDVLAAVFVGIGPQAPELAAQKYAMLQMPSAGQALTLSAAWLGADQHVDDFVRGHELSNIDMRLVGTTLRPQPRVAAAARGLDATLDKLAAHGGSHRTDALDALVCSPAGSRSAWDLLRPVLGQRSATRGDSVRVAISHLSRGPQPVPVQRAASQRPDRSLSAG